MDSNSNTLIERIKTGLIAWLVMLPLIGMVYYLLRPESLGVTIFSPHNVVIYGILTIAIYAVVRGTIEKDATIYAGIIRWGISTLVVFAYDFWHLQIPAMDSIQLLFCDGLIIMLLLPIMILGYVTAEKISPKIKLVAPSSG